MRIDWKALAHPPRCAFVSTGFVAILFALLVAIAPRDARATERSIVLSPVMATSWEFVVPGTGVRARRNLGVGFWQRASGAKPGVGSDYVSTMEYQLPEAAPGQVRHATFQMSGRPSQCVGNEPVVIEVLGYAGNGKAEQADASAGSPVARMSAGCGDQHAFGQAVDVTALVRQLSVSSGVRHVGFAVRKGNHRQGPGLFELAPGKLTVVISDVAMSARAPATPAATGAVAQPTARLSPTPSTPMPAAVPSARTAMATPAAKPAPATAAKPSAAGTATPATTHAASPAPATTAKKVAEK